MTERLRLCTLAALTLAGALAHADEGIETDRPDFVESSAVVGAGHVQVETGVTFDRNTSAGITTRTLTTPTLLRIGLGETTEFRIEGDGLTRERSRDANDGSSTRTHGFADLALGIKWHMQDGEGGTPGVAWLAHVDTPSGSKSLRGSGLRPSLRAAIEWDLPDEWSFGVMPGVYVERNDAGRRYTGAILAATLGKAWSPRWHSFAEVAGQQIASKRNGGSTVTLDAGLTFLATPSLQFDIEFAHGVTDAAPSFVSGSGVSLKF
jgi:hypothetical protein